MEITEKGLKENPGNIMELLNKLDSQSICLAIEHLGTGFSSLAYLKHFPLDVLKIDKSIINDPSLRQDNMEIASAIIAMGHILGFKVHAEGVETMAQLAFLQKKSAILIKVTSKALQSQRKLLLI
ncbi:MAG: EAL domain-containing protein [Methylococcales bacterium]|nr:EAL domain-containing protein [Methylococcales bacterium]